MQLVVRFKYFSGDLGSHGFLIDLLYSQPHREIYY